MAKVGMLITSLHIIPWLGPLLCVSFWQELMLSGLPEINIEDWRQFTEYSGYDENSPQIQVSYLFVWHLQW